MAKLTNKSSLVLDTNLVLDKTNWTFELIGSADGLTTNGLIPKDGVTIQAVYARFIDLWYTPAYQDSPFPMHAVDVRSGQFKTGTDGQTFNHWRPKNDDTRNMLRDGGLEEWRATSPSLPFTPTGIKVAVYSGIRARGSVSPGAQQYYQTTATGAAKDFVFTDEANQLVQVQGDPDHGNFDTRAYFRVFTRERGYTYSDAVLPEATTGPYLTDFVMVSEVDPNIVAADTDLSQPPYSGITVTYLDAPQYRTIGSATCPFTVLINGNGASATQVYTKAQYLLRQTSNINSGAVPIVGKTANLLLKFQGDTLYTTQGVFIEGLNANDMNNVVFTDQNNVERSYPYVATGTLVPSSLLTGVGGFYKMYFTTLPGVLDDFGETGALLVNDSNGVPISGSLASGPVTFTFDYDGNTQGGRQPGTDATCTVVAGRPGHAQPALFGFTLKRTKGMQLDLNPEQDRGYSA